MKSTDPTRPAGRTPRRPGTTARYLVAAQSRMKGAATLLREQAGWISTGRIQSVGAGATIKELTSIADSLEADARALDGIRSSVESALAWSRTPANVIKRSNPR